jgi:hypothetical protein
MCVDSADDKSAQPSGYCPAPVVGNPPAYMGGPAELHVHVQPPDKKEAF